MFKDSTSKQELKFDGLAPSNIPRKLTARDMALGIGRKPTELELQEYLNRPHGKSISLTKGVAALKNKLTQKQSLKNGNRNQGKSA